MTRVPEWVKELNNIGILVHNRGNWAYKLTLPNKEQVVFSAEDSKVYVELVNEGFEEIKEEPESRIEWSN